VTLSIAETLAMSAAFAADADTIKTAIHTDRIRHPPFAHGIPGG
jgi:hypothetical protein